MPDRAIRVVGWDMRAEYKMKIAGLVMATAPPSTLHTSAPAEGTVTVTFAE